MDEPHATTANSSAETNESRAAAVRPSGGGLKLAAAGLLGAAVAWLALAAYERTVTPWSLPLGGIGGPPGQEARAAQMKFDRWNNMAALAVVGAAIAFGCAAGGASFRRSWKSLAIAAPLGAILGAGAGALGGWAGYAVLHDAVPILAKATSLLRDEIGEMTKTLCQQAVVWATIGAAVGCGLAVAEGRARAAGKALIAAALGGGLAALAYVLGLAVLFPNLGADALVPVDHLERLCLFGLNGLLMGGFVGLVVAPVKAPAQSTVRPASP